MRNGRTFKELVDDASDWALELPLTMTADGELDTFDDDYDLVSFYAEEHGIMLDDDYNEVVRGEES